MLRSQYALRRRAPLLRLGMGIALVCSLVLFGAWFQAAQAAPDNTATIEVRKVVVPGALPENGTFDLLIDNTIEVANCTSAGCASTAHPVTGASAIISEQAAVSPASPVALSNYATTIACYDRTVWNLGAPTGNAFATGTGTSLTIDQLGTAGRTDIVCVITNTRKTAQLWVKKEVVDASNANNATTFPILIDGVAATNSPFANGQFSPRQTVNVGSHTVSEPADPAYNTSIRCVRVVNNVITGIHVAGPQAGNSLAVTVDDGDNKDVLCVVTNTRKVGKVEVIKKVVSPTGFTDAGKFDLQIDSTTLANDIGNGGSTGAQTVAAGSHLVGEAVDDPNTTASDYNSSLSCYTRANYNNGLPIGPALFGPFLNNTAIINTTISVNDGDDLVCLITNTRKTGTLKVVKDIVGDPAQSLGKFNLLIADAASNNVATAADQPDNGATAQITVPTGDYNVSETAGTNTSLAKYSSALTCTGNAGVLTNVTSTSATVPVAESETVVCTFTNTRLPGRLEIVKDLIPSTDTGLFNLIASGPTAFSSTPATGVGDGGTTGAGGTSVLAGAYQVSETAGTATTLSNYASSISCVRRNTNTVVASGAGSGPLALFVDSNDDIVCTITNKLGTIEIAKQSNPTPSNPDDFDFTATPALGITPGAAFSLFGPGTTGAVALAPGTYVVTESGIPTSWVLQDITCTGNVQSTINKDLLNAKVTITLVAGEDIKCTFKNVRKSIITLVKDASPADGTDFMFSVNGHSHGPIDDAVPDDNDGHADTLSLANLLPGAYTINEILPAGWVQTGVICAPSVIGGGDGTSPWSATPTGVQINLAGNEEVRCTFTNQKRGSITIKKAADPANGLDFGFTLTDPIPTVSTFTLDDANPSDNDAVNNSIVFTSLAPGAYQFEETLPSGWQAPTISCTSDLATNTNTPVTNGLIVNLDAGENVVCTFDNRIKRGGITVVKEAAPADGTNFSFAGDLGAFVLDDGDADAIPGSKSFPNLLPGNYKITEQVPNDWNLTAVTCVGGNGNDTLIAGGVQVTLDPDEQVTCTFRNVIKASGITIIKESLPNDPMNFTFNGGTLGSFTLDDDSDPTLPDSKIFTNLLPGVYTIGEPVPLPTGWDVYDIECTGAVNSQVTIGNDADFDGGDSAVTINLKPNEQVVCIFTNTKRGSVKIIKDADPADGTDFPFAFTGSNILFNLNESVTLDDDGNATLPDNKTYFDLPPGDYAIAENPPTGWSVTGRTCTGATNSTVSYNADGKTIDIDLAPGENLVCTYKNAKQGSITIVKDAFPAGATQFAFNSTLGLFFLNDQDAADYHIGDPLNGFSSHQFTALVPGSYNLNEIAQNNGWVITHIECAGGANTLVGSDSDFDLGDIGVTVNLGAGENVICEFANQFTTVSGLTLQKTVDPTTYNAVGQQLTYSFVIKNTGNAALTGVQIQEGLVGVTISCPGFNGQLAVGQQVICTGVYTVQQSDLDRGFIQNSAFAKAEGNITSLPVSVLATAVQTPKIALVKSVTDNNGGDVVLGDGLTYKFEVTNSGNVTLSGVKVTDPLPTLSALSCTPAQPTTLAPGAKLTCTAAYTVQQADVNTGLIQNTATAEGSDPGNTKRTAQHSVTVTVKRNLSLNLKKSLKANADEDSSGNVSLNDTLTYEFVVTNNSNVTLNSVSVTDPLPGLSALSCTPAQPTTLTPGQSMTCTATYKVKQSDVDKGQIINIAVASAKDANNTPVSAPASATVNLQQKASINLEKTVANADEDQSGGVSLNDTLTYQFKVTNDGNVTLNSVGVSDPLPGLSALSCTPAQPTTLTPGQSMTCTATYKVTSADVAAGKIKNTATATGIDAVTGAVASTDQVSVSTQQQLRLGLIKRIAQVTLNPDKSIGIVMEYTLQNQGNSELNNLALFDDVLTQFANFGPTGFIAANGSMTANGDWNGNGGTNVLAPFQTLAVGDQGTVYVGFKVTTSQAVQVQTTATANADGSQGNSVNESASATVDLAGGQSQPAGATVSGPNAAVSSSNILVSWTTQAENRISGFRLYRSSDGTRANAQLLGQTILSHGVATGSGYAFIDSDVQPNTTYTYWLAVVADGAEIAEHGPASATTPQAVNPTQPVRLLYLPLVWK